MLRNKILTPKSPVILYELIPPIQKNNGADDSETYAACALEMLSTLSVSIDAINIPEIHEEEAKSTPRTQSYIPKIDPREFARSLTALPQSNSFELIVNHCTVHQPWSGQHEWLDETLTQYGIHHIILVGGESRKVTYPGPSVPEMAKYINDHYPTTLLCGGITIPTRRNPTDLKMDEPTRLLEKAQQGIEFFTSQILYASHSMKQLLKDYDILCKQNKVTPKRIFLSFAPIGSRNDLDFLRWLGVEISATTEAELLKANIGIGWRSIKATKVILQEIMDYVRAENIQVPLGLNIEHITWRNFELSQILIEELGEEYIDFMAAS